MLEPVSPHVLFIIHSTAITSKLPLVHLWKSNFSCYLFYTNCNRNDIDLSINVTNNKCHTTQISNEVPFHLIMSHLAQLVETCEADYMENCTMGNSSWIVCHIIGTVLKKRRGCLQTYIIKLSSETRCYAVFYWHIMCSL